MATFRPPKCSPIPAANGRWADWFPGSACSRSVLAFRKTGTLYVDNFAMRTTVNGVNKIAAPTTSGGCSSKMLLSCNDPTSGYYVNLTNVSCGYMFGIDVFKAYDDGIWSSSLAIPFIIGGVNAATIGMEVGVYDGVSNLVTASVAAYSFTSTAPYVSNSALCSSTPTGMHVSGTITVYDDGRITIA